MLDTDSLPPLAMSLLQELGKGIQFKDTAHHPHTSGEPRGIPNHLMHKHYREDLATTLISSTQGRESCQRATVVTPAHGQQLRPGSFAKGQKTWATWTVQDLCQPPSDQALA